MHSTITVTLMKFMGTQKYSVLQKVFMRLFSFYYILVYGGNRIFI